jgi:streptogramin lyase
VVLPPVDKEVNSKDAEIARHNETINNAPAVYQKGPRRLSADRKGNAVWVAEYYAGKLAKIDIHTKKVTEYTVPNPNSHPYSTVVDRNHMVWVCLHDADRILKFDPFTEAFTEYPLPSIGSEARFIDVDDRTDPPTVWAPYYALNKIARVQFRAATPGAVATKTW